MSNKCEICKEKIVEDEMGKIIGTVIKVKNEDNRNELKYVCKECQKSEKDKELIRKKK